MKSIVRTALGGGASLLLLSCVSLLNFPDLPAAPSDAGSDGTGQLNGSSSPDGSTSPDGSRGDAASPPDAVADSRPLTDSAVPYDAVARDGASVADGGPGFDASGCANRCVAGETACADGAVVSCQTPASACPTWVAKETCGVHASCVIASDGGAAACACTPSNCTQPGLQCESGNLATCALDDASCPYVADAAPCPSGEICGGLAPHAACATSCVSVCDAGARTCEDGGLAQCQLADSGCYEFAPPSACADPNMACAAGAGGGSCQCTPSSVCGSVTGPVCSTDNSGYYACTKDDAGCSPLSAVVPCSNGACFGPAGSAACCKNACVEGADQCVTATSYSSCAITNGCTAWSSATVSCPTNTACGIDAGVAVCSCEAPFSTCQGACVNTASDLANCGGCGVTCNGTCYGGRCDVTLATGPHYATSIAVDKTSVYWLAWNGQSNGGSLQKVNIDGGAYTTLASGFGDPGPIAVSSVAVYWNAQPSDTVMMVPLDGGGITSLNLVTSAYGISANSSHLFVVANNTGLVSTLLNGTSATTLSPGNVYGPTAANESMVYWGANPSSGSAGALMATPLDGGATTTLAALPGEAFGLAIDSTTAYVTAIPSGTSSYILLAIPFSGATPTTLSSSDGFFPVAGDSVAAYWLPSAGSSTLWSIRPDATGAAAFESSNDGPIQGVALDSKYVYWTTYNGTVHRSPKL